MRARLEQAASLRGASIGTWSRWALDKAAAQCLGLEPAAADGDEGGVSLSRLEALEARLRRLESQVRRLESQVRI